MMKHLPSLLLCLGTMLPLLTACVLPGEEAISDVESYSPLRMAFPQGDHDFDRQIVQVHDDYGVYLIYKEVTDEDLNRRWTSVATGNVLHGDDVPDAYVPFYVNFFASHIFPYVDRSMIQRAFPVKIYMLDNFRGVPRDIEDDGSSTYAMSQYFDGFDFWAISFTHDEIESVGDSRLTMKQKRCAFLLKVFRLFVNNGTLTVPEEFRSLVNYNQSVYFPDVYENEERYYRNQGFIDNLNDDFTKDQHPYPETYRLMSPNYYTSGSYHADEPAEYRDYLIWLRACMFYTEEEFFTKYPAERYPIIEQRYHVVVDDMLERNGIDLQGIANGPDAD